MWTISICKFTGKFETRRDRFNDFIWSRWLVLNRRGRYGWWKSVHVWTLRFKAKLFPWRKVNWTHHDVRWKRSILKQDHSSRTLDTSLINRDWRNHFDSTIETFCFKGKTVSQELGTFPKSKEQLETTFISFDFISYSIQFLKNLLDLRRI